MIDEDGDGGGFLRVVYRWANRGCMSGCEYGVSWWAFVYYSGGASCILYLETSIRRRVRGVVNRVPFGSLFRA